MTQDVRKRIIEHNSGKQKYTKGYRPWELVYVKEFSTRNEARIHEKYLKSGIGREFLMTILDNKFESLT